MPKLGFREPFFFGNLLHNKQLDKQNQKGHITIEKATSRCTIKKGKL